MTTYNLQVQLMNFSRYNMSFQIHIGNHSWRSRNFENLKVKGYYSLNHERVMSFDCSQLRYYRGIGNSMVDWNLNEGFDETRKFKNRSTDRHLDDILQWIQAQKDNPTNSQNKSESSKPMFVCRRGLINFILKLPFSPMESGIICAAKWKDTIYLRRFPTEDENRIADQSRLDQLTHWNYKYQQYCISDIPGGSADITVPVDPNCQFCCVFQSHLGNHTLLYSAKIDAVDSKEILRDPLPCDELKFVGLKTNSIVEPRKRSSGGFAQFTTLKWWRIYAPTGSETILCGYRDNQGVVRETETFKIANLMKEKGAHWTSSDCLNVCDDFLTYVARVVEKDYDTTIYKFEKFSENNRMKMSEVAPSPEYQILPEWYTQNMG